MMDDVDRARGALFHLDAGCDRVTWIKLGMAFKAAGGDVDTWVDWCASGSNYCGEREARAVWRSFSTSGGISAATLFRAAIDAGWAEASPPAPRRLQPAVRPHEAERPARETLDPRWLRYWQSLGPVRDVGRAYLEARRCVLPPAGGDLRFDPASRHPSGFAGPALVALVTDVLTGAPLTLHRTWVSADGTKADVDPPRLLLGGHRKAGGAIKLWPSEAVTTGLAIAEGIETALSVAYVFQPVWALVDAGNVARLPVLAGVESLTIAVDDDQAGVRGAGECAERWAHEDREVTLVEVAHGA